MSTWNEGVYTQKGLALLAKLTQGTSLNITRAVAGTGKVSDTSLNIQTAVTNPKQELTFQTAYYPEVGTCKLPMYLTNDGVASTYNIHQIGLYATDPDEGEILYFIAQSTNGTEIPAFSLAPGFTATWTFYFKYGQANDVNVTVNPNNAVTPDMFEEVKALAETGASTAKIGDIVAFDDTANLPFATLSVYGKSTRDGIPVPTAPIDIVSTGDNGKITVTACGKNILCNSSISREVNGVTFTVNDDGTVTCNGTASETAFLMITPATTSIAKGTYTLSGCPAGGGTNTYRLYSTQIGLYDNGNGATATVEEDTTFGVALAIFAGYTANNLVIKPMLEVGSKVTEYEPHIGQPVTVALTNGLRGIRVESGGNFTDSSGLHWISDELNLATGTLTKRIGVVDLGSLSWTYNDVYETFIAYIDDMPMNSLNLLCSHYATSTINSATSPDMTIYGRSGTINGGIGVKNSSYTDAETFKTDMTGAVLLYELITPVEIPLSGAEIEACKALATYNPITVVFNDLNAEMHVDCVSAVYEPAFEMVMRNADGSGSCTLTHAKSGTNHAFTGLSGSGLVSANFLATASYDAGDTATIDGEAYTIQLTGADEPDTDLFVSGRAVSVLVDTESKTVNFKSGGGLSNGKLSLATATEGTVLLGYSFYAGDKTLKEGTYDPEWAIKKYW